MDRDFGVVAKNFCLTQVTNTFSYFYFRNFIGLGFTFRYLIHFVFTTVCLFIKLLKDILVTANFLEL